MNHIKKDVALKNYSNYKIGGNAAYFMEISSKEELLEGLKEWKEISANFPQNKTKIFVLGQGTNVLFSDDGFDGLVIRNLISGIEKKDNDVLVGAGTLFPKLLDFCIQNSLSGLEWAGGLPGTVGGAIRGNAGAFNGETKDNIKKITSLNLDTLETIERNNKECNFSYRFSIFKGDAKNEIILSAVFSLTPSSKDEIKKKIQEKIEHRNLKHPLDKPNIGSIFKNVPVENFPEKLQNELSQYIKNDPFPVVPSAKLIFLAGLKGEKEGDVQVSEKHTNFIVNLGNGKSEDVKKLISLIKEKIKKQFGVSLEEEIMYLRGGD